MNSLTRALILVVMIRFSLQAMPWGERGEKKSDSQALILKEQRERDRDMTDRNVSSNPNEDDQRNPADIDESDDDEPPPLWPLDCSEEIFGRKTEQAAKIAKISTSSFQALGSMLPSPDALKAAHAWNNLFKSNIEEEKKENEEKRGKRSNLSKQQCETLTASMFLGRKVFNQALKGARVLIRYFICSSVLPRALGARESAFAVYSGKSSDQLVFQSMMSDGNGAYIFGGFSNNPTLNQINGLFGKLNFNGQKDWVYEQAPILAPANIIYDTAIMDGALYVGGYAFPGGPYLTKNSLNGTLLSTWAFPEFNGGGHIHNIFPTAKHTLICFGNPGTNKGILSSFVLEFQPSKNNVLSSNYIDLPGNSIIQSVVKLKDNSYIIGGYTGTSIPKGFLSKIHNNGSAWLSNWTRFYSSGGATQINSVAEKNNTVIFAGNSWGWGIVGSINETTGVSNWINSIGIPGGYSNNLNGVSFKKNNIFNKINEIVVVGTAMGQTIGNSNAAWYILMNLSNGTLHKSVILDGAGNDAAQSVIVNNDGTFTSFGTTTSYGHSSQNLMFVTLDANAWIDPSILPSGIKYRDNHNNMTLGVQPITSLVSNVTFPLFNMTAKKINAAFFKVNDSIYTIWQQVATQLPTSQPSRQPSGQPTRQPTSFISGSLNHGLVAYYPFDGNARDQSGNGNNGVVHNATLTADRFGNQYGAYHFDGIKSYIEIVNGGPFDFINNMSVAVWVNPVINGVIQGKIFSKSHGANGGSSWLLTQYSGVLTNFEFWYKQSLSNIWTNSSTTKLIANQWNHYSIVKENTKISSYLNGVLVSTSFGSYPRIKTNGNFSLFIGGHPGDFYLRGSLDDIFIFNRTLTPQEVLQLYQFDAPTSQPTSQPTRLPSSQPSRLPSTQPSRQPSSVPTRQPVSLPTGRPSCQPTSEPSAQPTRRPSSQPSVEPTGEPSRQPSVQPSSHPSPTSRIRWV